MGKLIKTNFTINNEVLEPVQTLCYLGFDIKSSGIVTHAMNSLYDKAYKAMRPLRGVIAKFNIPVKIHIHIHIYPP